MSGKRNEATLDDAGRIVLLVLLLGALYLAFRIIRPFLDPILLAAILAPIVYPLFRWLRDRLRGRATPAAVATCLLVVIVILGPLSLLTVAVVNQGASSVQAIQTWVKDGQLDALMTGPKMDSFRAFAARAMPLVDPERLDLKKVVLSASSRLGNFVASNAGALLSSTGGMVANVVLMLFILFFFVRDGEALLVGLRALSPLRSDQEEMLLKQFRVVSRSSLLGILGTAVAQGTVGGIGLAIAGLPGVFWGSVMVFTSLIPFVGTALVWAPAVAFLLITGHTGMAIFLALWSILLVGTIDNFLRPILMKGGSEMSTLWMLFAVLGGLQLFGMPGLVYGPIVFGLCQVLLRLYQSEFGDFLTRLPPPDAAA
jgi:predicted PurR-regulated permease PerM